MTRSLSSIATRAALILTVAGCTGSSADEPASDSAAAQTKVVFRAGQYEKLKVVITEDRFSGSFVDVMHEIGRKCEFSFYGKVEKDSAGAYLSRQPFTIGLGEPTRWDGEKDRAAVPDAESVGVLTIRDDLGLDAVGLSFDDETIAKLGEGCKLSLKADELSTPDRWAHTITGGLDANITGFKTVVVQRADFYDEDGTEQRPLEHSDDPAFLLPVRAGYVTYGSTVKYYRTTETMVEAKFIPIYDDSAPPYGWLKKTDLSQ